MSMKDAIAAISFLQQFCIVFQINLFDLRADYFYLGTNGLTEITASLTV